MPRAFFVSKAEVLPKEAIHERLRKIAAGEFTMQQLRRYVLLDEASISPGAVMSSKPEQFAPARVRTERRLPGSLRQLLSRLA